MGRILTARDFWEDIRPRLPSGWHTTKELLAGAPEVRAAHLGVALSWAWRQGFIRCEYRRVREPRGGHGSIRLRPLWEIPEQQELGHFHPRG